jgi:glucose/arabinose dehydrogenase
LASLVALPSAARGAACAGDCRGDGAVSIADLILGVGIALGSQPASACTAMDSSGDGIVTVDELIRAVGAALEGCPATPTVTSTSEGTATAPPPPTETPTPLPPTPTDTPTPTTGPMHFCDLPGSVLTTGAGISVVSGGPAGVPDLSFMSLPVGFCAHYFAKINNTRQLRFAPGGDLFVASPTQFSTSNGQGGQAAVIVLPDDDHDGTADAPVTFMSSMPATAGLLFTGGYLYYQDHTKVMRMPFTPGDRAPSGPSEQLADINSYTSPLHWPKTMDIADDGTIYVANGGDEGEFCDASRPFHGGILKLDGSPSGAQVARGFRNPIAVRCARGHNMCFAAELTRDYSTPMGGREKILPIRDGDDWGFPCCATKDTPFPDIHPVPDCSMVSQEIDSFFVGHTPFDMDFEPGKWPDPWKHRVYVTLHGTYGVWEGASIVSIDFDTMSGQPLPGSDLPGVPNGALYNFATGWYDNGSRQHGRPTVVAFAPDGRLFLGNDTNGDIIWIAPIDLEMSGT